MQNKAIATPCLFEAEMGKNYKQIIIKNTFFWRNCLHNFYNFKQSYNFKQAEEAAFFLSSYFLYSDSPFCI